jgi:hypothetical protein
LIITLVFEKNSNFFAENRQKSQKIVIITSTPGHPGSAPPLRRQARNDCTWRVAYLTSESSPRIPSFPRLFFSKGTSQLHIRKKCRLRMEGVSVRPDSQGWPDWANFRLLGDCLLWTVFLKITEVTVCNSSATLFHWQELCM